MEGNSSRALGPDQHVTGKQQPWSFLGTPGFLENLVFQMTENMGSVPKVLLKNSMLTQDHCLFKLLIFAKRMEVTFRYSLYSNFASKSKDAAIATKVYFDVRSI